MRFPTPTPRHPPPSLLPPLPPPQPLAAHNFLSTCVELTECLLLLIEQVLAGDTELLQVRFSQASTSKAGVRDVCGGDVCYLVSQDVRELLHLTGPREHLWSLLRKHSQHQHTDRHLATHVAHVWREEVRARMIGSTLTNSSSPPLVHDEPPTAHACQALSLAHRCHVPSTLPLAIIFSSLSSRRPSFPLGRLPARASAIQPPTRLTTCPCACPPACPLALPNSIDVVDFSSVTRSCYSSFRLFCRKGMCL